MCQMKASLINIRLTSRYSAGSYAFAVKGFCALFSAFNIRSAQLHSFMATLTCIHSVGTNLTLTCPFPKSFVCNLPDSERHVTSVFQGFSLSRSVGWVGENPGNEVGIYMILNPMRCTTRWLHQHAVNLLFFYFEKRKAGL